MNNAIERIKGYCTEVNQAQWDELVRVADEVGVKVWNSSRNMEACEKFNIAFAEELDKDLILTYKGNEGTRTFIPFPDFIAKIRGVEEWMPKAGEMVEVRYGVGAEWYMAKFVGNDGAYFVCRHDKKLLGDYTLHTKHEIRQAFPTITRAEAEHQLGKRIID
jgi:hypothetical protein